MGSSRDRDRKKKKRRYSPSSSESRISSYNSSDRSAERHYKRKKQKKTNERRNSSSPEEDMNIKNSKKKSSTTASISQSKASTTQPSIGAFPNVMTMNGIPVPGLGMNMQGMQGMMGMMPGLQQQMNPQMPGGFPFFNPMNFGMKGMKGNNMMGMPGQFPMQFPNMMNMDPNMMRMPNQPNVFNNQKIFPQNSHKPPTIPSLIPNKQQSLPNSQQSHNLHQPLQSNNQSTTSNTLNSLGLPLGLPNLDPSNNKNLNSNNNNSQNNNLNVNSQQQQIVYVPRFVPKDSTDAEHYSTFRQKYLAPIAAEYFANTQFIAKYSDQQNIHALCKKFLLDLEKKAKDNGNRKLPLQIQNYLNNLEQEAELEIERQNKELLYQQLAKQGEQQSQLNGQQQQNQNKNNDKQDLEILKQLHQNQSISGIISQFDIKNENNSKLDLAPQIVNMAEQIQNQFQSEEIEKENNIIMEEALMLINFADNNSIINQKIEIEGN